MHVVQELGASDEATTAADPTAGAESAQQGEAAAEAAAAIVEGTPSSGIGSRVVLGVALGCGSLLLLALVAFVGIRWRYINKNRRQAHFAAAQKQPQSPGTEQGSLARSLHGSQHTGSQLAQGCLLRVTHKLCVGGNFPASHRSIFLESLAVSTHPPIPR